MAHETTIFPAAVQKPKEFLEKDTSEQVGEFVSVETFDEQVWFCSKVINAMERKEFTPAPACVMISKQIEQFLFSGLMDEEKWTTTLVSFDRLLEAPRSLFSI